MMDKVSNQGSKIIRYEFAPFDMGFHLYRDKSKQIARCILNELGWSNISDRFDQEEYASIIEQALGVYQKDRIWLFVADSGFCVVRYAFDVIHANQMDIFDGDDCLLKKMADTLLERITLHKSIALTGTHSACVKVQKLVEAFASRLPKHSQNLRQFDRKLHQYSVSVYAILGGDFTVNPMMRQAFLFPRNIGCSSSVPECLMPTRNQIFDRLKQMDCDELQDIRTVGLRQGGTMMYASWSGVIIEEPINQQAIELVSLCEFWLQSVWLSAFSAAKTASNFNFHKMNGRDYAWLNMTQQSLKRMNNKLGLKLNPNAPSDPSAVMNVIAISSDLAAELQNADEALEYAITQANYILNERNLMTRKLLEIFSLVFASSSLAPLLLPTPLSIQTIKQNTAMFIIWLALTVIGIMLIARQR